MEDLILVGCGVELLMSNSNRVSVCLRPW
jgi:hypothetical protein